MCLVQPRFVRAEDALSYKFQSWREDGDRIRVDSHYGQGDVDPTPELHIKVMGLIDTITGSTPTGEAPPPGSHQVVLSRMEDIRRAQSADISYKFPQVSVAAGYVRSVESDYISDGFSLNTLTDFNQKNTTLLLGYGHAADEIQTAFMPESRSKTSDDLIVGVTQLLGPNTTLAFNVSWGRSRGYLSDPYKLVETALLFPPLLVTVPENRPGEKTKAIGYLGLNHNVGSMHGAIEASYRFYEDTYGITSHTFGLEWFQKLGPHFILSPGVRYYRQSAADFYYASLDAAGVTPGVTPSGRGPYYSSDYRLDKLESLSLGLKLVAKLNDNVSFDVSYERYMMRGLDSATSPSAFPSADVFTFGVKISH